jgi:hypothetical protein
MANSANFRRFSMQQAAEQATALAKEFLVRQHPLHSDWKWEILGAKPDPCGKSGKRKVGPYWNVLVTWTHHEAIFDGPAIVTVNLETSEVQFWPSDSG